MVEVRDICPKTEGLTNDDPARFLGMTIKSYLLGRSDLSNFESHLQEMARMWSSSPNLTVKDLNEIEVPTVIVGDHLDVSLRRFYRNA